MIVYTGIYDWYAVGKATKTNQTNWYGCKEKKTPIN